ncbi:hypothetical protein C2845_PM10G15790 [Panicum miliaceum]|uniref:Uncharacterized protein n=1 Tax=Panicum miliaceum TaxID=4540 RepID=A0A3L6PBS2_PANMI|nr:hypothetical protein C2845_PM10G15790 [Panicum miliaceum]
MPVPGDGNTRRQKHRSSNVRGTIVAVLQSLSEEQEPSRRLPQDCTGSSAGVASSKAKWRKDAWTKSGELSPGAGRVKKRVCLARKEIDRGAKGWEGEVDWRPDKGGPPVGGEGGRSKGARRWPVPSAPDTPAAAGGESDGEGNRNRCSGYPLSHRWRMWGFRRFGLIFENAERRGSSRGGQRRQRLCRGRRRRGGGVVLCACVSWTGRGGDEEGGFRVAVLRIAPQKSKSAPPSAPRCCSRAGFRPGLPDGPARWPRWRRGDSNIENLTNSNIDFHLSELTAIVGPAHQRSWPSRPSPSTRTPGAARSIRDFSDYSSFNSDISRELECLAMAAVDPGAAPKSDVPDSARPAVDLNDLESMDLLPDAGPLKHMEPFVLAWGMEWRQRRRSVPGSVPSAAVRGAPTGAAALLAGGSRIDGTARRHYRRVPRVRVRDDALAMAALALALALPLPRLAISGATGIISAALSRRTRRREQQVD